MGITSATAGLLFKIDGDSSQLQKELKAVDSSFDSLGGKASTLGGAATIAAAGIAAIGTAVVTASVALFKFTKDAADLGSTLYDASVKTGLGAKSISALKLAADGAGSSLESISGSVSKFNVLLGQAAQGNEKAQATLKQYGITSKDTNEAFNEAIEVIGKMTTADQRAVAAKDLFKDRTGEIIPIIDQVNGNFKEFIATAERLGVTLTEKDLKAADEFGDTLGVLGAQAEIAGVKFASELMPMVIKAMNAISGSLAENQSIARDWGRALADTLTGTALIAERTASGIGLALRSMDIAFNLNAGTSQYWAGVVIDSLKRTALAMTTFGLSEFFIAAQRVGADARPEIIDSPRDQQFTNPSWRQPSPGRPPNTEGVSGGRGGGGGRKSGDPNAALKKDLDDKITLQKLYLQKYEKEYKDTLDRIRAEFEKTGDDGAFANAANAANTLFAGQAQTTISSLQAFENQKAALEKESETQATLRRERQQQEINRVNELGVDELNRNNKLLEDSDQKLANKLIEIREDLAKKTEAIRAETAQRAIEDTEKYYDTEIEYANGNLEEQNRLRSEKYDALILLLQAELDQKKDALKREEQDHKESLEKYVKDEDAKLLLISQLRDLYKNKELLSIEEFEKAKAALQNNTAQVVTPGGEYNFGLAENWEKFVISVKKDGPEIGAVLANLGQMGWNALSQLADGLGSVVQNWVLAGGSVGKAMKQMVASILAGVAAQAAVLAIFELAKGFAALFFNPAEAAAHFKAAALFGVVAVGAGLGGRAMAGDSFKQQTANGGAGPGATGSNNGRPDNFTTNAGNPFENTLLNRVLNKVNMTLGQLEETSHQLATRMESFSPGEVIAMGAGDATRELHAAIISELKDSGRATGDYRRSMGDAR